MHQSTFSNIYLMAKNHLNIKLSKFHLVLNYLASFVHIQNQTIPNGHKISIQDSISDIQNSWVKKQKSRINITKTPITHFKHLLWNDQFWQLPNRCCSTKQAKIRRQGCILIYVFNCF